MAWKEEHTHIHFHNDNKEIVSVLKEIRDLLKKNGESEEVKQLEAQMDSWLATLKQSLEKIKAISERV